MKQHAEMSLFVKHIVHKQQFQDLYFAFKIEKKTGLLIFNSLKQKKLIFNFFVNRNWKKLADSRKRAKILADNRKSHHPIETLLYGLFRERARPNGFRVLHGHPNGHGISRFVPAISLGHFIKNPLLTQHVQPKWLDIGKKKRNMVNIQPH